MSKQKLGWGIIGCGGISGAHCHAVAESDRAEIVAVCDIKRDRAEKRSEEFGGDVYEDYNELLAREDVDCVSICVPSGLHAQVGIAAAKAKKHILTEKPLDITLPACDAFIQAAEENGVVLSCVFQNRYKQSTRLIKQLLEEGKLGQLLMADLSMKWWRAQSYYDDEWHGTWALDGGGAIMNQCCHYVDLLQYFVGPFKTVRGRFATMAHKMEADDVTYAWLERAEGGWASIIATTAAYPGYSSRIELHGTEGSIIWENGNLIACDLKSGEKIDLEAEQKEAGDTSGATDPMAISLGGHRAHVENLCDCVLEGAEPTVSGREARKAVEIINAIIESGRRQSELVELPLGGD